MKDFFKTLLEVLLSIFALPFLIVAGAIGGAVIFFCTIIECVYAGISGILGD